jgi:hypothetical protein
VWDKGSCHDLEETSRGELYENFAGGALDMWMVAATSDPTMAYYYQTHFTVDEYKI